jgi:hypothetical protein
VKDIADSAAKVGRSIPWNPIMQAARLKSNQILNKVILGPAALPVAIVLPTPILVRCLAMTDCSRIEAAPVKLFTAYL